MTGPSLQKINPKSHKKFLEDFVTEFHSTPEGIKSNLDDWERDGLTVWTVRNSSDEVIGITSLFKISDHLALRQKTIISFDYRGKGWGRWVIKEVEKEAKKAGFGKISSHVFEFNKKMLGLLMSEEYYVEGFLRDHDAPGLHEYILGKMI